MGKHKDSSLVAVAASLRRHRPVPSAEARELLYEVAGLRAEGKTWRQVGAALGRHYSVVFRTVNRWLWEYDRALRKLKRPRLASRVKEEASARLSPGLVSRLSREEAYVRLEKARLERKAAEVIYAALDNPKPNVALRAAEAWCRHVDPEPYLLLPQPAPEPPEDPELDAELQAVLGEFAALPDEESADGE